MLISRELARFFESGLTILVGTRDAAHVPDASRAAGARVSSDGTQLTLYLPETGCRRALDNLEVCGLLAATFSRAFDHRTLQVKGRALEVRPARDAERPILERYVEELAAALEHIGLPPAMLRQLPVWPARAVTMTVDELYEQTPGPKAGLPLEEAS